MVTYRAVLGTGVVLVISGVYTPAEALQLAVRAGCAERGVDYVSRIETGRVAWTVYP